MSKPLDLFERLVAAGDITAADSALLAAEWESLQRAMTGPGATALDEEEYWSLRLLRDLARALAPQRRDPAIECALDRHEQHIIAAFSKALAAHPTVADHPSD